MLAILVALFVAQQFGTQTLGRFFGPVMLVWFSFIGVMGALALSQNVAVLKALNPIYVYRFLVEYPGGFWLLGGVFLCTTGAEALYSDMGHCGRGFTLGFRIEPRINYFFELVLEDLVKNRDVERTSRHPALQKYDVPGDLRFVLTHSFLSYENDLPFGQNFVLRAYYFLRRWLSIREDEAFGLDASNVVIENVPLVVSPLGNAPLQRES